MSKSEEKSTRRSFLKSSTVAATGTAIGLQTLHAPAVQSALNANEKVRVGFIGVGNRGSQLLASFMKNDDMQVTALCDVYEPYLGRDREKVDKSLIESVGSFVPKMGEKLGSETARYKDFRQVLDRKDIDAVVIATPDHWHAIQTISACEAGKDIYVEKPLSVTVSEGRKMVEAAKRYNRIVQVGLHRRSSKLYTDMRAFVQTGQLGKVTVARANHYSNMFPKGIGKLPDSPPPAGLDWEMWLGPRADKPYKNDISPYKFRWWLGYSSQVGNWGVHYFDAIRWILDQEAPLAVSAVGGKYALDDDRTIPDTMHVTFELPGKALIVFGLYEACGGSNLSRGEVELLGTLGNVFIQAEADGYILEPTHPGQFQDVKSPLQAKKVEGYDNDLTDQHVRNFLDCVKSREHCHCDLETGHRSTTFIHLANIAWITKNRLEWDAEKERITNFEEANQYLQYEYRAPWKLG